MGVVRRRPVAVVAATVLAMGALSACGGESDAEPSTATSTASPIPVDPSSSSSSSSSKTSSSSSTKGGGDSVDLPKAATKHTQEGAVAFAKYYWESTGVALRDSDTTLLEGLVSEQCNVCQSLIEKIDKNKTKGLSADQNPTTVTSAAIASTTNDRSDEAVRLKVTDAEHNFVKDGEAVGHVKAIDFTGIVYLDWEDGAWIVVDGYIIT